MEQVRFPHPEFDGDEPVLDIEQLEVADLLQIKAALEADQEANSAQLDALKRGMWELPGRNLDKAHELSKALIESDNIEDRFDAITLVIGHLMPILDAYAAQLKGTDQSARRSEQQWDWEDRLYLAATLLLDSTEDPRTGTPVAQEADYALYLAAKEQHISLFTMQGIASTVAEIARDAQRH